MGSSVVITGFQTHTILEKTLYYPFDADLDFQVVGKVLL